MTERATASTGARVALARGLAAAVAASCVAALVAASAPVADAGDDAAGSRASKRDARRAAQVELGRRLFFDPAVSAFGRTSCSSCHDPEHAFGDPRPLSMDELQPTSRHSQSLLDVGEVLAGGFHWDGEFETVADLVSARVGTPTERSLVGLRRFTDMARSARATAESGHENAVDVKLAREGFTGTFGNAGYGGRGSPMHQTPPRSSGFATPRKPLPRMFDAQPGRTVASRLNEQGAYAEGFRRAFDGPRATTERVATAIERYVHSLRSTEAPYDRFARGDESALSDAQARGLALFTGKAGCSDCHTVPRAPQPGRRPSRAFTDGSFRNTGVSLSSVGVHSRSGRLDVGRAAIDFRVRSRATFKVPNLRDVARSAPYMHDGSFSTLHDVVDYYARGGLRDGDAPRGAVSGGPDSVGGVDPAVHARDLNGRDRDDLVAFLESLTGDVRPGLGRLPDHRAEHTVVVLRDLEGSLVRDAEVTVCPTGDRLAGTDATPEPFTLRTDARGRLAFPFPASTHVVLRTEGAQIGGGRFVPDTTRKLELRVVPNDVFVVRLFDARGRSVPPPRTVRVIPIRARSGSGDAITFRRARATWNSPAVYVCDAERFLSSGGPGELLGAMIVIPDRARLTVSIDPAQPVLATVDLGDSLRLQRVASGEAARLARREALEAAAPFVTR